MWDLSATLGWAAGGPGGSWLTRSTANFSQVRMSCYRHIPSCASLHSSGEPPFDEGKTACNLSSLLPIPYGWYSIEVAGPFSIPKELFKMPMSGVQGRDQPQPLGAFCEARTHPERYWRADVFNVLTISKSGLIFGMMRTPDPNAEWQKAASDTSDAAYSNMICGQWA